MFEAAREFNRKCKGRLLGKGAGTYAGGSMPAGMIRIQRGPFGTIADAAPSIQVIS